MVKTVRLVENHTNITRDIKIWKVEKFISAVVFVWTLRFLINCTFATKDVHHKIFQKISPAVFFFKIKTGFCSDFCTQLTGSDLDLSKYESHSEINDPPHFPNENEWLIYQFEIQSF